MYYSSKGETDILHQRMRFYTTKTTCRRWNIAVFSYVLDTAIVSTTFAMNKVLRKENTSKFLENFSKQMVEPIFCQSSVNELQRLIFQKIQLFLKDETLGIKNRETPRNKNDEHYNIFISETAVSWQKISNNDNCILFKAVYLTRTWHGFTLFIKTNSCFSDIHLKVW